jgi:hypothetical protein
MAPPRPRCCLNVGVTGHRLNRISQSDLDTLAPTLDELLRALAGATSGIHARERAFFADDAAGLRLLSGLAEGSDRYVAAMAMQRGFALHALLPFDRDDYAADFAGASSNAEYRDLLARAERVFEFPGERDKPTTAYEMTGRALIAHADVLIALWDGEAGQGRGGTAEVVAMALARGLPVIHLTPSASVAPRILWSGYATLPVGHAGIDEYPHSPSDATAVGSLVEKLLLPEDDAVERACLAQFLGERERRFRPRIEYPLLLALAGVRRFGLASLRAAPYAEATAHEWSAFRDGAGELGIGDEASAASLQGAYAWSDSLANHFAQLFRSGHVANFSLSALAVVLALSGLVWPAAKFWLIVGELAIISLVVLNTQVGRARQWHRRWLDYRYLAECLRPMRSLALYGLVGSAARRRSQNGEPLRWPDWYADALWREVGCPSARIGSGNHARLNRLAASVELQPQIDYHEVTAHRMHILEHRLHRLGNALFAATIAACLVFLVGYFAAHDATVAHAPLFTAITAALPALGGAIYGIRVQGDFGGAASRSHKAAYELAQLATALTAEPEPEFARAAALMESAARVMLADLAEWQLTYRQRGLAIPA